jgi:hypothetical protein
MKLATISASAGIDLMRLNARHREGLTADVIQHRESLFALGYQMVGTVRRGDETHDAGGSADPMQILGARCVGRRINLQQKAHAALGPHRLLSRRQRCVAGNSDR